MNSAHPLNVHNVSFLVVVSHVGGQSNSMFSRGPREYIVGASSLSLCGDHFVKLREDRGLATGFRILTTTLC